MGLPVNSCVAIFGIGVAVLGVRWKTILSSRPLFLLLCLIVLANLAYVIIWAVSWRVSTFTATRVGQQIVMFQTQATVSYLYLLALLLVLYMWVLVTHTEVYPSRRKVDVSRLILGIFIAFAIVCLAGLITGLVLMSKGSLMGGAAFSYIRLILTAVGFVLALLWLAYFIVGMRWAQNAENVDEKSKTILKYNLVCACIVAVTSAFKMVWAVFGLSSQNVSPNPSVLDFGSLVADAVLSITFLLVVVSAWTARQHLQQKQIGVPNDTIHNDSLDIPLIPKAYDI